MLKKTFVAATFAVLASTTATAADNFKPEDAVKYRQAIYQIFAAQTTVLGGILQGKIEFNAQEVNQRAKNIAAVAPLLGETYFPATRNVKSSKFKAASWGKLDDVGAKGEAFGKALNELVTASSQADFSQDDASKTIGAVLQSCKSCHDSHRSK